MTKQEKVIVSAYTGKLMCDFGDVHEYIEKKLGRPVYTHELAYKNIWKEIEEKSKEDFLEICKQEEPAQKTGKWMREVLGSTSGYGTTIMYQCTNCEKMSISKYKFCPNCGARMENES